MANSVASNGRPVVSRRADARTSRDSSNNSYEVLLARLQSLGYGPGRGQRTVGITSSLRREGVTTVACNLALYAAGCHDWRVLLVDANHSNPNLHRIFHLPQAPGYAELSYAQGPAADCIHDMSANPVESWPPAIRQSIRRGRGLARLIARRREQFPAPQLSVMPAGNSSNGVSDFCVFENEGLLEDLGAPFDLVIVDLPESSSPIGCGSSLSNLDGVLFVLEAETTSDIAAQKTLRQIGADGANVLGVVFNKCRTHLPRWIDKKLGD